MVYTTTEMTPSFIGTVAKRAAVPIKTIRYYEEIGLLRKPARTASGYRLYAPDTADRLQFIKKAQSLGLRLDDIKEILDLSDRGRCPCGHVQAVLRKRLNELRQKITDLRMIERRVEAAVRRGYPPNFRPRGKAICPTIDRQPLRRRSTNKMTTR